MNLGAETAAAMVAVEQAKSEGERHRAEAAVAVAREQTKQRKAAAAQAQREAEERTRQEQEATQRAREETQRAREATVQSGHRLWRVVASCVTVGGGIIGCAITSSAAASISVATPEAAASRVRPELDTGAHTRYALIRANSQSIIQKSFLH